MPDVDGLAPTTGGGMIEDAVGAAAAAAAAIPAVGIMAMSKDPNAPKPFSGWACKCGHVFATWKRRYFVLAEGFMIYYEGLVDEDPNLPTGEKGNINLTGYSVEFFPGSGETARLVLTPAPGSLTRDLTMEFNEADGSDSSATLWAAAIKKHIQYIDNKPTGSKGSSVV